MSHNSHNSHNAAATWLMTKDSPSHSSQYMVEKQNGAPANIFLVLIKKKPYDSNFRWVRIFSPHTHIQKNESLYWAAFSNDKFILYQRYNEKPYGQVLINNHRQLSPHIIQIFEDNYSGKESSIQQEKVNRAEFNAQKLKEKKEKEKKKKEKNLTF